MITVKATREGLVGQKTASGYIIDTVVPFVALPSHKALGRFVKVTANGRTQLAVVLDVGPFNEHDDTYVLQKATATNEEFVKMDPQVPIRPQAESGVSVSGKGTNGAGIDLGEKVWNSLGMKDNGLVGWEFIDWGGL